MVTTIVVDASVLIVLAKIRRLVLLRTVYGQVLIGPVVHREVVTEGKRVHARGVELVEQALSEGWLRVVQPTSAERSLAQRLLRTTRLDAGEAEALALAQRRKRLVVIDDKEARHVAGALGVSYLGTAGVLLEARLRGQLTLSELEDAVHDLTGVLWLAPGVVATILKRARENAR